jgi:hypothetical protein
LYLGSWQLLDGIGAAKLVQGNEGYLNATIQEIHRYSTYTITANPNVLVAAHEQLTLSNCNFYLQPEVYLFPGTATPVAGFRTHPGDPAWIGQATLTRAPLADTDFFRQIEAVGLYLRPGVEAVQVRYKAAIISDIYTDYPAATVPTCEFQSPDCNVLFAAHLISGNFYATEQDAINAGSRTPVTSSVWTCPNDSTDTRTFWIFTD